VGHECFRDRRWNQKSQVRRRLHGVVQSWFRLEDRTLATRTSLSRLFILCCSSITSAMSLSRLQVLRATTTSPWTKDFRHMGPIPRHWMRRKTTQDPYIKAVPPKQRIKFWNIVPGDQIRVKGDPEGAIHEVLSVNRISNRVFLKGISKVSIHSECKIRTKPRSRSGPFPPRQTGTHEECALFEMPTLRWGIRIPTYKRLGAANNYAVACLL
jgi:hypothetical protein